MAFAVLIFSEGFGQSQKPANRHFFSCGQPEVFGARVEENIKFPKFFDEKRLLRLLRPLRLLRFLMPGKSLSM